MLSPQPPSSSKGCNSTGTGIIGCKLRYLIIQRVARAMTNQLIVMLLSLPLWLCACTQYATEADLFGLPEDGSQYGVSFEELAAQNDSAGSLLDSPLTIDNAITAARQHNPGLVAAVWNIRKSKAMLSLADSRFWPQLSFYSEYMQGDAPSSYLFKTIDQRLLPADVNFNDPGWFENFESGFTGRINLFNGFKDSLSRRMAEKDITIAKLDRNRVANDLTAQVIESFYDALTARDFVSVAKESVSTVSEQLRIMQIRYRGGAVVKSDVLSMEVRLAQVKEQLLSSRNRHRLALASLANLMGREPTLLVGDAELSTLKHDLPEIPEDYETAVVLAVNSRPELDKMRRKLEKARMGVRLARGEYLPRLDFSASYYLDTPDLNYDRSRENWNAALKINWDLFSGFSRPAAVTRAETMANETAAAFSGVLLDVKLDLRRAYFNLEEAERRHTVAQNSIDAAEESFRLVREHYQGGAVTVTRYLEAELDLNRARIRVAATRYNRIKARADVVRALGLWAALPEATGNE